MASVEWQTTCTDMKQRGALLLKTEEFTDCELLVGPEAAPVHAHKLMLAMASPVFESMFYEKNREEQTVFVIPDVDPTAFGALVNYIYTENINISTYKEALSVFLAAHKFLVMQLAKVCAAFMSCNITAETACSAHHVGYKFHDENLMYESLLIIKQNIKGLLWSKSFEEADVNTVAAIFAIPDLQVDDKDLYKALLRYASAHEYRKRSAAGPETNETGLATLTRQSLLKALRNIRFLTFTMEELAEGPAQSGLLTREQALSILVNIAGGDAPMPLGFTGIRDHRYKRPVQPQPATALPKGTLRVSIPNAHAYDTFKRSVTSARVSVAGRAWQLTALPHQLTDTTRNPFDMDNMYLAVFLKCLDTAGGSCLARVEFNLVAYKDSNTTASCGSVDHNSGNSNNTADRSASSGSNGHNTSNNNVNSSNKTVTIEKTFSSAQNEYGESKFAKWINVASKTGGYKHNDALVVEAHVTVLQTSVTCGAPGTS
ncbi:hypothetical protein O0L34_g3820 [Tuta absoluta]|nr:hypothetical protein O0L34_g3820 [Tuta absoluta]